MLASVPDPRDPRGRRYSLMACWRSRFCHCRGMRGYAGFAHGRHRFDDVLAK
ncbi:hypothetical protein I551_8626 [Mycobacterium ulcerans str. Harvey]|uniref:Uncharacterized protein n=1 Tax=Mycobacterium ulcerans str. Harvey TaxID=1299332 RepID=A0ABN0RAB3_MYCUL|nr:hypothetical protein I551_8626 [Mycobacterium ulcerans str. Harvey]